MILEGVWDTLRCLKRILPGIQLIWAAGGELAERDTLYNVRARAS